MVIKQREKTATHHVIIFGSIFIAILGFITFSLARAVSLYPSDLIVHTSVVYYEKEFSAKNLTEDLKTALYVLNQSNEYVYATVYEYDKNKKEVATSVQVGPWKNQFIKTDGPGVVYLSNADGSATSTVKFSRRYTLKKYTIPDNFRF